MEYQYITALLFAEGSEGPVKEYLHTMEEQYGFAYPLPPLIPLAGYSSFFPPDRVDRKKLKELEELGFKEITQTDRGIILSLTDPGLTDRAASCLRGIHGKEKPCALETSPFAWKGILLHPGDFPYKPELPEKFPAPPECRWKTYRYSLLRLRWPEKSRWWHHIEWELLWSVRKAKRTN